MPTDVVVAVVHARAASVVDVVDDATVANANVDDDDYGACSDASTFA